MDRRNFLWVVASVGVVPETMLGQHETKAAPPPPAPVMWTVGLNPNTHVPETEAADAVAESDVRFFSAVQMATLTRLCALLMPASGGKPGAVEVGTPFFFDFFIGASSESRKQLYAGGLNWLEGESRRKFKVGFAGLSQVQADELVRPWLRTWMSDHPPLGAHEEFVNIVHDEMRTATMNSKAWNDAGVAASQDWVTGGLYWSPIEPDMAGLGSTATRLAPHVMAEPKAAHTMPSYPR